LYRRTFRRILKKSRKRIVRYGLLVANLALLLGVVVFVVQNSSYGQSDQVTPKNNAIAAASSTPASPLDQVSSADIAVNVARMTNLAETAAVTNYADSFNAQVMTNTTEEKVVAKPQVVMTAAKSRKDIQTYVTKDGDTVSGLASTYGVTSDSIKNTNNLTTDRLAANQTLTIPPMNGIVYTVKAGDTVDSLAQKYSANKDLIISINDTEVVGIKPGEQIIIPDAVIPVTRAAVTYNPVVAGFAFGTSAIYGNNNGYAYGWCTWYVANRRIEMGNPVPNNLGNASTWYVIAQRAGLPTGNRPQVGAVAVNQGGNHVSVVEHVNEDGSFWVSEMNAYGQVSMTDTRPTGGWNRVDWQLYSSPGNLKFIY
jgi:N-acetylmuramoyl-L-alanine amidase